MRGRNMLNILMTGTGIVFWLVCIPFLLGTLLLGLLHRERDGLALCMVIGYLMMFALSEITAVPMILTSLPFHVFFWILAAEYLILAVISAGYRGRTEISRIKVSIQRLHRQPWTIYAAVLLVAVQAFFYFHYMVTNLDDAYYVGVATTTLETDTMYQYSPYTGLLGKRFNLRYILSPFSIFQAFLSKGTGLHPSTLAHTVLPVFLVSLGYLVYYCLGRLLFSEKALQGKYGEAMECKERLSHKMAGFFMIAMSLVNMTSYYNSARTQGTMMLVRIWQGKAVLASVLLPFLFYQCYRMAIHKEERGGLLLLMTGTLACCLVSSMGIALPPVMLGIFALLFGLFRKNIRYFLQMAAGCLPCVFYGILYLILQSAR